MSDIDKTIINLLTVAGKNLQHGKAARAKRFFDQAWALKCEHGEAALEQHTINCIFHVRENYYHLKRYENCQEEPKWMQR